MYQLTNSRIFRTQRVDKNICNYNSKWRSVPTEGFALKNQYGCVASFTFYSSPGILSRSSLQFVDDSFFTTANHCKWNLLLQLNTMTGLLVKIEHGNECTWNLLRRGTYIHVSIHLGDSLIVNWESVNFYSITCKFFHDLKKKKKKKFAWKLNVSSPKF